MTKPPPLPWNRLPSDGGQTFAALVGLLLRHLDPGVVVFDRPGPDGSQDARSGDGKTVYQFKHYKEMPPTDLRSVALAELEKIARYREPGHANAVLWSGAEEYVFITSATKSPHVQSTWDRDVVPRFRDVGLSATLWMRRDIEEKLLEVAPHLISLFFEDENRAFLSLGEARERLVVNPLLAAAMDVPLVGRGPVIESFERFLAGSERVLSLVGEGGQGKSRTLWELGRRAAGSGEWDVLWANTATLSKSHTWFAGLSPSRAVLLLVDEPDSGTAAALLEQLARPREHWKAVLTWRPHDRALESWAKAPEQSHAVCRVELGRLDRAGAAELARHCLPSAPPEAAGQIADWSQGIPIWIVLAADLWRHGERASVDPDVIARREVDRAVSAVTQHLGLSQPEVLGIVRWLALLQPITAEALAAAPIAARIDVVEAVLGSLTADARLARRLEGSFAVEPDVIRDWILERWLVESDSPKPSPAADRLIEEILAGTGAWPEKALATLASVQQRTGVPLVDAAARALVARAGGERRVSQWFVLVERAAMMAPARPDLIARLSGILRRSPLPDEHLESIIVEATWRWRDLLPSIVQGLGTAARWASTDGDRRLILRELLESAAEWLRARDGGPTGLLAGDPLQALRSAVAGGRREKRLSREAGEELRQRLAAIRRGDEPDTIELQLIAALATPLLEVRRVEDVTGPGYVITVTPYRLLPDAEPDRLRRSVRDALWEIPGRAASVPARLGALKLLERSHHAVREYSRRPGSEGQARRDECLDDLRRCRELLEMDQATAAERVLARGIWEVHLRADEADPEAALALDCERRLMEDPQLGLLPRLVLSHDDAQQRISWDALVARLVSSPDEIVSTLELLRSAFPEVAAHVGWQIGLHLGYAGLPEAIGRRLALARDTIGAAPFEGFAAARVRKAREVGAPAPELDAMVRLCSGPREIAGLLQGLYGPHNLRDRVSGEEVAAVLRHAEAAGRSGSPGPEVFAVLGNVQAFLPDTARPATDRMLSSLPPDEIAGCFDALLDGVCGSFHYHAPAPSEREAAAHWILGLLVEVPDLGRYDYGQDYDLQQVLRPIAGTLPLDWLAKSLERRQSDPRLRSSGGRLLAGLTRGLAPDGSASTEDTQAIERMLALLVREEIHLYQLSDALGKVDPAGRLVPALAAKLIRALPMGDSSELYRLAQLHTCYPINSEPWRVIARPVLDRADRCPDPDQARSIRSILHGGRITTWSGSPDEVAEIFPAEVRTASRFLREETDPVFEPFWREWLESTRHSLAHERGSKAAEEGLSVLPEILSEVQRIADRQAGFISETAAAALGLLGRTLEDAIRLRYVYRVRPNLLRRAESPSGSNDQLVSIWAECDQRCTFSHETALELHGLSDVVSDRVHVTLEEGVPAPRDPAVEVHRSALEDSNVTTVSGLSVTSPERTIRDCIALGTEPKVLVQAVKQAARRGMLPEQRRRELLDVLQPRLQNAAT